MPRPANAIAGEPVANPEALARCGHEVRVQSFHLKFITQLQVSSLSFNHFQRDDTRARRQRYRPWDARRDREFRPAGDPGNCKTDPIEAAQDVYPRNLNPGVAVGFGRADPENGVDVAEVDLAQVSSSQRDRAADDAAPDCRGQRPDGSDVDYKRA